MSSFIGACMQIMLAGFAVLGVAIVACLLALMVGGTLWFLGKLKRDRS